MWRLKYLTKDHVLNKIISLFLLLSATSAYCSNDFPEKLSDSLFSKSTKYEINFPLWTDGAIKDRFYYIPEGTKIDNSNFSAWKYPDGVQFWKNFSGVDGKIETRTMLKKNGSWLFATYRWDGSEDAYLVSEEGYQDAGFLSIVEDLTLDIPSQKQCVLCHNRKNPRPVGFEGIQLVDNGDTLNLLREKAVFKEGFTEEQLNMFRLEGLSESDKYMAGYLQGNCSSCHNEEGYAYFLPIFKAPIETNSIKDTKAQLDGIIAKKSGRILFRTSHTDPKMRMPKIGSKIPHPEFQEKLKAWIANKKK